MSKKEKWAFGSAAVAVLLIVVFALAVEIHTVKGNEMAVLETWNGGVQDEPFAPKTYVRTPGFMYTFYNYDMSSQVYVMNDTPSTEEFAQGREKDSYEVPSSEGQDMNISMNVTWRLDPDRLVHLHKTVRKDFDEKVLRPALLRHVKDQTTVQKAIVAYSGVGLVELQANIFAALSNLEGDVRQKGIIVDNFVIERIKLDPAYIGQIKAKQVAVQRELRAKQEEKAALAEAQRAKADAQADYETQLVAALRDKDMGILKAEKAKQERVLAAEAEKQEQVLRAEGEKESGVLKAEAIKAIGEAEAYAQKVKLQAYAVDGADNFVKIEVANALAQGFQNIDGYLPADMQINVLTDSFMNSLSAVMGGSGTATIKE